MATPQEYYNTVIGKGFDEDGVYRVQCADGFKHFCRTVVGYNISKKSICSPTNLATSIWDNFESLGLNKYFDKVDSDKMVDGDWAIWAIGSKSCPSSHIAMFRKDNGNGTGVFLGQNQLNKSEYTQINIYYDGLRGGLRPKIYHQSNNSDTNTSGEVVDQILHKGSKVQFYGCQIEKINKANDTFYSSKFGVYLPLKDFTRVGGDGQPYANQVVSVGNWLMNYNTYQVKSVSKNPDKAVITLNGKDYNVLSAGLQEV